MSISKLFNVNYVKQGLKVLFLPAVLALPLVAGGCAVGGGIGAGAITAGALRAAGVNQGTANLIGVAVGLGTAEIIANQQQAQGRCTERIRCRTRQPRKCMGRAPRVPPHDPRLPNRPLWPAAAAISQRSHSILIAAA